MFWKIFALLLLSLVGYIGGVFFFPEIVNQYGNKELNLHILEMKWKLDNFASTGSSRQSLIDSAGWVLSPYLDSAKGVIKQWQDVANQVQHTIEEKAVQAEKAKNSLENAYKAVDTAKQDFKNLSNFNSGSKN